MTSSSPTSSATSTARTDLYPLCGVLKAVDDQSYGFEIPHRVEQFIVGRDLECDQPLLGEGSLSESQPRMTSPQLALNLSQVAFIVR